MRSNFKTLVPQFIRMKIWTPIHSYVFQFIRMSSKRKIWTPIHSYISYVFQKNSYVFPKKNLNPNSFVCIPIHSYVFKKNRAPIHSYIFQFIRISSPQKNIEAQLIRISSEFIRMSSELNRPKEAG